MASCVRKERKIVKSSYDLTLSHEEACVLWRVLRAVGGSRSGPRRLITAIEEELATAIPETTPQLDNMFDCTGLITLSRPVGENDVSKMP